MQFDVVGGPPGAELLAVGAEFADQIGVATVVEVETSFGSWRGDAVPGDGCPRATASCIGRRPWLGTAASSQVIG